MSKNEELFLRAQKTTPGGVNSPVRAFRQVGGVPRFVKRAEGAYFWDADDRKYIDCIGSWGPMIVGHAHPAVVKAVQDAAVNSFSYGAPTEAEIVMGLFTGRTQGVLNMREGKVIRFVAWCKAQGLDAAQFETWGYSDSINDLPLLLAVTHANVTQGDEKLRAEAAQRGWPQIDWF